MPAHIHPAIKEPNIDNEYYIDEFVFDDDKLLTSAKRRAMENRGGSGVLRILLKDDLQVAVHDIVLGLHIPNYPKKLNNSKRSGLEVGEDQPSFTPYHAYGADKGTRTCPVCKYGRYHGIMYFAGDHQNWDQIKKWLLFLEQESAKRKQYLKAYFVYGNNKNQIEVKLEEIGAALKLKHLALTYVPSFDDQKTEVYLNKINPSAENTFIVYRNRSIIAKFIDLEPSQANFKSIEATLEHTKDEYFYLPAPNHH